MDSFVSKQWYNMAKLSLGFLIKLLSQFIALLLSAQSCILDRPPGRKKNFVRSLMLNHTEAREATLCPIIESGPFNAAGYCRIWGEQWVYLVAPLQYSVWATWSCSVHSLKLCSVCGKHLNFASSTFPAQHLPCSQKSWVPLSYFAAWSTRKNTAFTMFRLSTDM